MSRLKQVRRIAWSIFWKTSVVGAIAGYLAGFLVGFILGFIGAVLGLEQVMMSRIIAVLGMFAGIAASFFCFNFFLARAIGKQIGSSRLEVVDGGAFGERT